MILNVAVLFFLVQSSKAFNEQSIAFECLNYTIYPLQYELTVTPYIEPNRIYYNCDEVITVIANSPNIRVIELDACDMEIASVKVSYLDREITNSYRPYEMDKGRRKLVIYLNEPMLEFMKTRAQYEIRITFRKIVTSETEGIFVVPYEDDGKKYMIMTRLSPDKAKHFFPCFDDQEFESPFKFRVYFPPDSLGMQPTNTSLVISKEQRQYQQKDSYMVKEYIASPQVTLYQVGFHFSQFDSRRVTARDTNDTVVIWAPTKDLHNYDFILDFSEKMLNLILDYSSNDLNLVYGPINIVSVHKILNGYEIGSWNLLTNGENRLKYDSRFTSIRQLEQMKYELALQLSRIWLGNPGEIKKTQWKQEWFKEGVATYLAYYFLTQNEQKITSQKNRVPIGKYGIKMKHKAMENDWDSNIALSKFEKTLMVNIPSRHRELVQMKTASLLWMVENWIGSEKFHRALVGYIKSRRGDYINLEDFLGYVSRETKECEFLNGSTGIKLLDSWFNKSGYPVIHVNVLRDRNVITLKQHKFSFKSDNDETLYMIPVSYKVQNCYSCHQPRFMIEEPTYTFKKTLDDGWIILDINATGYYRVNYDPYTWKQIAQALREDRLSIPEQNRAQIVNDAFALYVAGDIDQALAVEILNYLDMETSPVVWDAAISGFELLKIPQARCNMTKNLFKDWQDFMLRKVNNIYAQVVSSADRMFRRNIIAFACAVGHQKCLTEMRRSYDDYLRRGHSLDPDVRETCYKINFRDGYFRGVSFNIFEYEDKILAERNVKEEIMFRNSFPEGTPEVGHLMVSSTLEPVSSTPEPVSSTSEPVSSTEQLQTTPKGASSILASLLVLTVSVFILSILR